MPRTGGGTNTCILASWMLPSRWRITWAMELTSRPGRFALVEVIEHDEERAGIGGLVKVAPLRPVKPLVYLTPGVFSTISVACLTISSVREMDGTCRQLDGDDCNLAIEIGNEPGRDLRQQPGGEGDEPGIGQQHQQPELRQRADKFAVAVGQVVERPVEGLEEGVDRPEDDVAEGALVICLVRFQAGARTAPATASATRTPR